MDLTVSCNSFLHTHIHTLMVLLRHSSYSTAILKLFPSHSQWLILDFGSGLLSNGWGGGGGGTICHYHREVFSNIFLCVITENIAISKGVYVTIWTIGS